MASVPFHPKLLGELDLLQQIYISTHSILSCTIEVLKDDPTITADSGPYSPCDKDPTLNMLCTLNIN